MDKKQPSSNYNLTSFQKVRDGLIATNDNAYQYGFGMGKLKQGLRKYSEEEIANIITSGSIDRQVQLSQNYFYKDGFYKRLIIHYATLLKYSGILIPNAGFNEDLSKIALQKRYYSAMSFVDKMNLKVFCSNAMLKVFRDGSYFGVIVSADSEQLAVLDLPSQYCQSRYKDLKGNDIIEFNLHYFDTISWAEGKEAALRVYPKFILKAYKNLKKGKLQNPWIAIPPSIGICFQSYDGRPPFLNVIPATIRYDESVGLERERELNDIHKMIVQKMPHLNDGRLVFEPDEAAEMHAGTVAMLKGQKNTSVITSFADVDVVTARGSSERADSSLENMRANIYHEAGATDQLFFSTGSSTIEYSLKNDLAFVMSVANKISVFITNLINNIFGNKKLDFAYEILPISYYNEDKFIDNAYKLANSGYSLLMPAIGMGISQSQLGNIKVLENDVLKLGDKLLPLQSSHTQSPDSENNGAPEKPQEEKKETTLKKEESLDNTGG